MFIVKKNIHGREYYYLNENKRIKGTGKVKTKTIAYLGKTKKEAEKKAREIIKKVEKRKMKKNDIKPKKEKKIVQEIKKQGKTKISIEELANFCKKKGFVFRSSDIYGGFAGFWDFGHLGIELLNNIKREWWNFFVREKENIAGMEASILSHPKIWKASGHLDSFKDVMGRCKKCGRFMKFEEGMCTCSGELEKIDDFNLMFETKVGIDKNFELSYLRPETAQGMFTDFKLIQQTSRMQLPFGIAQIGKCFRNEIAPRDFLFRSREFHIAELEFFINPDDKKCDFLDSKHLSVNFNFLDKETQKKNSETLREVTIEKLVKEKRLDEWHAYWLSEQILWIKSLGLNDIKVREHTEEELSHYSSATFDIDYKYPFGSKEIAGIANRGQFDLTQHQNESRENMEFFDENLVKKIIPKVIEPTFGVERIFLAILSNAYYCDKERNNIVLKIPPKLSPIKAAIFPIVKQPKFEKISGKIVKDLKKEWNVVYDKSGSIGRRYARNDEIGTPMCITIDEQTPKDNTVTIRWRDTTEQVRIKIKDLKEIVREVINGKNLLELGKLVHTRKK